MRNETLKWRRHERAIFGINIARMYKRTMCVSILSVLLVCSTLSADSVAELQANYSGSTDWNSGTGTLTFESTGTINFPAKTAYKNNYWDVPLEVSNIIINANVTVTGAFHTFYTCTIEGVERYSSVVFGTSEQRWAVNRGIKAYKYSQFENRGGVLTVKNLTSLNPFGFHIRGWNKVNHAKSCDFIDNRGGGDNRSDGFVGGHGSTVDDCYFETGDDIIKCYFDITVTNTTINMIQNSVPFQFGWGTYQASHSVLSDITIIGDRGRGDTKPVFQWMDGEDYKSLFAMRLDIQNPNAALFELPSSGTLDLDITNSYINVEEYGTSSFTGTRTICSTTSQTNYYNCYPRIIFDGQTTIKLEKHETGQIQVDVYSSMDQTLNWTITGPGEL